MNITSTNTNTDTIITHHTNIIKQGSVVNKSFTCCNAEGVVFTELIGNKNTYISEIQIQIQC